MRKRLLWPAVRLLGVRRLAVQRLGTRLRLCPRQQYVRGGAGLERGVTSLLLRARHETLCKGLLTTFGNLALQILDLALSPLSLLLFLLSLLLFLCLPALRLLSLLLFLCKLRSELRLARGCGGGRRRRLRRGTATLAPPRGTAGRFTA